MKKIYWVFVLVIVATLGFSVYQGYNTIRLEKKVKQLEVMGMAGGVQADFRPFSGGLTGGGAGALDKPTSTENKDAAIVILEADGTYGNAFFPYTLDVDGGGVEDVPTVIDAADGGNEDWELCKGIFNGLWVYDDIRITDTKSIKNETDTADDYFSIETTDDVGGTPAQVEAMRVTNAGTSAAPLVEIGDSGATAPTVVTYIQAGADAMADQKYSGIVITGLNAGEAITAFDLVYFDGTENEWMIADADAAGKFPARGIALAAGTNGNPLDVLVKGVVREDTVFEWTANGATLYLDDVAGDAVEVAGIPATSDDCIQVVGWSITNDMAYFDFDGHWMLVE